MMIFFVKFDGDVNNFLVILLNFYIGYKQSMVGNPKSESWYSIEEFWCCEVLKASLDFYVLVLPLYTPPFSHRPKNKFGF
jgi:hypothetical protein